MRYKIKIVPNAEPNAEGEWIDAEADECTSTLWRISAARFDSQVPAGFHVVYIVSVKLFSGRDL